MTKNSCSNVYLGLVQCVWMRRVENVYVKCVHGYVFPLFVLLKSPVQFFSPCLYKSSPVLSSLFRLRLFSYFRPFSFRAVLYASWVCDVKRPGFYRVLFLTNLCLFGNLWFFILNLCSFCAFLRVWEWVCSVDVAGLAPPVACVYTRENVYIL